MSKKEEKPTPKTEDDLNDLLDNALKDFEISDKSEKTENQGAEGKDEVAELWNEDFFAQQAQLLGEKMNSIFGVTEGESPLSPDQITASFEKMAEAAVMALQGDVPEDEASKKYAESISEALKGLKDGVDNLPPLSETDVANMFPKLTLDGGLDNNGKPLLNFMQGMLRTLTSAEILLPGIKDLLEKYPKFLRENAEKLSQEDKERYQKQQDLFGVICRDLEEERPEDSSEMKEERFKRVLDNIYKLQEFGQPPDDVIEDIVQLPGLGAAGGGNNQCPMM